MDDPSTRPAGDQGNESGPAQPADGKNKRPWRTVFKAVIATIVAIPAIVAAITGISGLAGLEEAINPAKVEIFANNYFDAVVAVPGEARELYTTENFRQLKQTAEPEYSRWWDTVDHVEVYSVYDTERKNTFRIEYELFYENGVTEEVRSLWLVTCVDTARKYAPFFDCSSRDLRLDYFSGVGE